MEVKRDLSGFVVLRHEQGTPQQGGESGSHYEITDLIFHGDSPFFRYAGRLPVPVSRPLSLICVSPKRNRLANAASTVHQEVRTCSGLFGESKGEFTNRSITDNPAHSPQQRAGALNY